MSKSIPASTSQITVLLADDHPIVMDGFEMSLVNQQINVIGKAKTPDQAVKMYGELKPDVLIIDLRFGTKMTGLDAGKEILQKFSGANVIFLSHFDQDGLVAETYNIGGRAFITKDVESKELGEAIRIAVRGESYFMPRISDRIAKMTFHSDRSPAAQLDPREMKVFILMAKGDTNAEMAAALELSLKTISVISQSIKDKLKISRPADITRLALKHGYIEP